MDQTSRKGSTIENVIFLPALILGRDRLVARVACRSRRASDGRHGAPDRGPKYTWGSTISKLMPITLFVFPIS